MFLLLMWSGSGEKGDQGRELSIRVWRRLPVATCVPCTPCLDCICTFCRIAEKLLKSETGDRVTAPEGTYSLFMTAWINLNIHDWFFHEVADADPWTLQARHTHREIAH